MTVTGFAGDQGGREIIATRIIDRARNGVVDAAALHMRVMAEARRGAKPLVSSLDRVIRSIADAQRCRASGEGPRMRPAGRASVAAEG